MSDAIMSIPENVEVAIRRMRTLADSALGSLYEVECQREMRNACILLEDAYRSRLPAPAQGSRKLCWARPLGATMDSMRKHVWETGLADLGDTVLVWVNEGDFWMLALNGCEMKEYKNPDGPSLSSTERADG